MLSLTSHKQSEEALNKSSRHSINDKIIQHTNVTDEFESQIETKMSQEDDMKAVGRLEKSVTTQPNSMLAQLRVEFPHWEISDHDIKKLIKLVTFVYTNE